MATNKEVITQGAPDSVIYEEFLSSGAVTPGQLLEIDSNGAVKRHSTAGGNQSSLFADINVMIGDDIDDTAASGERVPCFWAQTGVTVNGLLKEGETVAIGGLVESDGAGDFQAHSEDSTVAPPLGKQIIGVAREALDLSDSSGADPASRRLKVTII
jgi:hypothetical protein